jgi:hypothetical protein
MFFYNENSVKIAVDKIGGVTIASNILGVSNGAVHSWIKRGKVVNITFAKRLSELSRIPLEKIRPV